jgi:hypothetical protein
MHVKVQVEDGCPRWPSSDFPSDSLAAFLIAVDFAMETNITRRSMPELLDNRDQWTEDFGAGGSLPRPDDSEVQEAIRALAHWAATQRGANPLAPFQQFAFDKPPTDEGLELRKSAWQKSGPVASACWALREAIRAEPGLQVLDTKFPLLASPGLPNRPKSNLDALREIALGASGRRLRLLLAS